MAGLGFVILFWAVIKVLSNIEEAFKVKDCLSISGKSLLLVDDVWTTGNTLSEMSRILKNSGAFKVYMLTLARRV